MLRFREEPGEPETRTFHYAGPGAAGPGAKFPSSGTFNPEDYAPKGPSIVKGMRVLPGIGNTFHPDLSGKFPSCSFAKSVTMFFQAQLLLRSGRVR